MWGERIAEVILNSCFLFKLNSKLLELIKTLLICYAVADAQNELIDH